MPSENQRFISVIGAAEHNLKNIDVQIPRNALTVITGISGSGKSSLAFDTIYEEALLSKPVVRKMAKGRVRAEDVYAALAQIENGKR